MGRILVVDGQPTNLELMVGLLGELGCEVATAPDGLSALDKVRSWHPDVVLLDVMMPDHDGYETCRLLKSAPATRQVPVVLVTALGAVEDRIRGLEVSADDFLTKPVDARELRAKVTALLRLRSIKDRLESAGSVVHSLAKAVEARDQGTEAHTERVAESAIALGELVGLFGEELEYLYLGALIHDVGKIGVPDGTLGKPGRLDADEQRLMRRHVVVGHEIVVGLHSLGTVAQIVRHHHEYFDGTGYPDGLAGEKIPLQARIVSICDAFDAMSHDRVYRAGMSVEKALDVLQEGAGTQWDPVLVRLFVGQVANVVASGEQR